MFVKLAKWWDALQWHYFYTGFLETSSVDSYVIKGTQTDTTMLLARSPSLTRKGKLSRGPPTSSTVQSFLSILHNDCWREVMTRIETALLNK
jgi:hypothetical protein